MTVNTKIDKDLTKWATPEFRVSYPHLFKPQAPKGSEKLSYSITMLFPKDRDLMGWAPVPQGAAPGTQALPRSFKQALTNAKLAKFGPKENWPAKLFMTLYDGDDAQYEGKEGYAGHHVMKASSNEDSRPVVVGADGRTPLTEAKDLYPGCYARAFIYLYVCEPFMGKQWAKICLDGVQKTREGKPFAGAKRTAEQMFSPVVGTDDADETGEESFI